MTNAMCKPPTTDTRANGRVHSIDSNRQNKGVMPLTYQNEPSTSAKPVSAQVDQAGAPEIEVTDEMITAGKDVLWREISVWFGPDYDSAEVAEKVFRAMCQARRPSS